MFEEVLPGIFRIQVPLPGNPLQSINSYLVKGSERDLIIDTGMNREECRQSLCSALAELRVDLDSTDFFITHLHADHLGLVFKLASKKSKVYFNGPDAEVMRKRNYWQEVLKVALMNGFPENELQEAIAKHPGFRYSMEGLVEFTILKEGDVLEAGDYFLRCVETPGHTRGIMCLYEPGKKVLFSGDHILGDITPNISLWSDDSYDPLNNYLESLDKVYNLEVDLVLPGHRRIFRNYRQRIRELKEHHRLRVEEIRGILEESPGNAYQVASRMSWDLTYASWEQFPVTQKWFAAGEALAHLRYMENKGLASKEKVGERFVFSLKSNRSFSF